MAFFINLADGFWGMEIVIIPFPKTLDTGRKRIVRDIVFRGIPP